jgi:hypothetical protein
MGVAVPLEADRKRDNYVEAPELERAVRSLMGGGEEGRKAKEKAMEMKLVCRNAVEQSGSSYASLETGEALLGSPQSCGGTEEMIKCLVYNCDICFPLCSFIFKFSCKVLILYNCVQWRIQTKISVGAIQMSGGTYTRNSNLFQLFYLNMNEIHCNSKN